MKDRPVHCVRNCGPNGLFKNGQRVIRGVVTQQYGCRKCGSYWLECKCSFPEDVFGGFRIPIPSALKAVAMFAIDLPMSRIERSLGIKAETVKKLILHFTAKEEIWEFVRELLMSQFRISEDEMDRLRDFPGEFIFRREPFRGRAFDFRQLNPQERRRLVRRAKRIAKRKIAI